MLFVSHLRPKSVDQLSSEVSLGFVGTDIEVGLTCGSQNIPINLAVSEFAPKSHQAIPVATISDKSFNGEPLFEYQSPPPIAFNKSETDLLERCRNHVKFVVKRERTSQAPIAERSHKIRRLILKAITRYLGSVRPSKTVSEILLQDLKSTKRVLDCNFGESNDASCYLHFNGNNIDDNRVLKETFERSYSEANHDRL